VLGNGATSCQVSLSFTHTLARGQCVVLTCGLKGLL